MEKTFGISIWQSLVLLLSRLAISGGAGPARQPVFSGDSGGFSSWLSSAYPGGPGAETYTAGRFGIHKFPNRSYKVRSGTCMTISVRSGTKNWTCTGVKCAVLEKSKVFSTHPQAHFINNRSMEVFRKMDGLAEEILSSQPPVEFWRRFIYCTSLTGPILGSGVDVSFPEGWDSPFSSSHVRSGSKDTLMDFCETVFWGALFIVGLLSCGRWTYG
nr:putative polyketide hydroxylase isoform X1 [Ipomoea batatas]